MKKRCPNSQLFSKGILREYRLDFTISDPSRWNGGGCADVVSDPNNEVWGLIYNVDKEDEINLDIAEGPRYRKIYKSVETEDGITIETFLYEVIDKKPFKKPSMQYLKNIITGAENHEFSDEYLNFLKDIETID